MPDDKFKQLELLVAQTARRLQSLQGDLAAAHQKIRTQENLIARLRESENELKALREWKRNTVSVLKKLETRLEKEINKVTENSNGL